MIDQIQVRAYECGVIKADWARTIHATSAGKAKSIYWHDLQESWPNIPYTEVTCRVIGKPRDTESFQRTARYRGVPFAHIGMKVSVEEMPGTIVGNNDSANFDVLFTEGKFKGQTLNCHPNWKMRYFDDSGTEILP